MRTLLTQLLVGLLLLPAARAQGEQAPSLEAGAPEQAERRYHSGRRLYAEGKVEQAAEEFRIALGIFPGSPKLAFNLGRCLERLGRLDEAVDAYREYQASDPGGGHDVDGLVKSLEERLRALRPEVLLSTEPSGATVYVDDGSAPLERPTPTRVRVEPGGHVFRFVREGFREAVRAVDIEAGGETTVNATLVPESGVSGREVAGWSLLGAGVVAGGVAAGFGFAASSTNDDAEALGPALADASERADLEDDFDRQQLAGWISAGLGVAFVATGATLLLLSDGEGEVGVSPGPGSLTVGGCF